MHKDLEAYGKRPFTTPAYRWIRESDKLPHPDALGDNPVAKVKLFNPTGQGTWWIAAYDPATREAYGVAEIFEREAGYIYMPEIAEHIGRFGLPIERDLHYTPRTLREILSEA